MWKNEWTLKYIELNELLTIEYYKVKVGLIKKYYLVKRMQSYWFLKGNMSNMP